MAERKSFLLRIDREVHDALSRWAEDDLRSLNGQIEFLLRRALREVGRAPKHGTSTSGSTSAIAPRTPREDDGEET